MNLRQQGSGNLGATNVFRVLGWKIGVAVFLADALKGALPVLLLPAHIDSTLEPTLWAIGCGIAAIAGHVRPLFLGFRKGGKGVATAAGVFFALAPVPMLATFVLFVAVVLGSGYVSLGSLLSAALLPAAAARHPGPAGAAVPGEPGRRDLRVLDAPRQHRAVAPRRGASLRQAGTRMRAPA